MEEAPIRHKILLVDDEEHVLEMLQELLRDEYETVLASSGPASVELVRQHRDIAAIVMDIKMAGMDGIEAAREINKIDREIPVIFHTGYPGDFDEDEIDIKEKPFDYIQKGDSITKLSRSIRNAVDTYHLKRNNHGLVQLAELNYGLIGRSSKMQAVYQKIRQVSASDSKVIIYGETGTGKDLVARAIHYNGRRKDKKFAFHSCHHSSQDLTRTELFGYVRGAFTGADEDRPGLFEYADGGTLFLDEIGDMDMNTQEKLLKVLDYGEYVKVGSPEVKKTDVRVVCATHKNLEELVKKGGFREDLYFRLGGIIIKLPPLRERREDIPLLIERFKDRFTIEEGNSPKIFDLAAIAVLLDYNWPGNVRQLMRAVESLIVQCDSSIIFAEDVRSYLAQAEVEVNDRPGAEGTLSHRLREYRKICIIEALNQTGNNISAAAKILGIDRSNLRKMIKDLDINVR